MSGAGLESRAEILGHDRRCAFMAKPFGVETLRQKLAELQLPPYLI